VALPLHASTFFIHAAETPMLCYKVHGLINVIDKMPPGI